MKSTQSFVVAAQPFSVVAAASTAVLRRGNWLHCRLGVERTTPTIESAIRALLEVGAEVMVLEGGAIRLPRIAEDGIMVWSAKPSRRMRKTATVRVAL